MKTASALALTGDAARIVNRITGHGPRPLNTVPKLDQVAALMLLVFKENPNAVMTRRDVESVLNLDGFSVSTRQRALNHLAYQGHIREESDWPGGRPTTYRLKGTQS
jgi:hypothetical protein